MPIIREQPSLMDLDIDMNGERSIEALITSKPCDQPTLVDRVMEDGQIHEHMQTVRVHQPGFLPPGPNTHTRTKSPDYGVEEEQTIQHIIRQVEYYFSDENLDRDAFLFDSMGGYGNRPIPIPFIHTFPRLRKYQSYAFVVYALRQSKHLKVVRFRGLHCIIRRRPYLKPGPQGRSAASSSTATASGSQVGPWQRQIAKNEAKEEGDAFLKHLAEEMYFFTITDRQGEKDGTSIFRNARKYDQVEIEGSKRIIRRLPSKAGGRDADNQQAHARYQDQPGCPSWRPDRASFSNSHLVPRPGEYQIMDYEPRREYRGGGGGGGGYRGTKRRYREDDDDSRPQQRYNQRREPPSARVRKLLLGLADNPMSKPEDDVVYVAKQISDNHEDEKFREITSDLVVQLVQEQPFKIPFVAAVMLYTNQTRPDFVMQIIEKTGVQIRAAMTQHQWRALKLLLRFLGSMQDVLEGDGIFGLLEELFDRAADLQSASTEDALGLELVKIIMLTFPYVMAASSADLKEKASELLGKTDIIASAERETETVVDPYVRFEGTEVPPARSYLAILQRQLQSEAERDWPLRLLPRLFKPQKKETEDLIEMDGPDAGERHPLPELNISQSITLGSQPLFPEIYYSVYADQDFESVPPTSDIAASLVRDAAVDTIDILDFNRHAVAKILVEIDNYYTRGTFAPRATPFDTIRDFPEGKSTWKTEDIALDALFSQVLRLPAPEHKLVYYHALVAEVCKIAPAAFAPCLGRLIRFLYRQIEVLDVELVYRFLDFFSQHLSNFDFKWKWEEWIPDAEKDLLSPRKAFCLALIDKEMRLSFAGRIRETLPAEFERYIPAKKDNEIPDFKYNNEVEPFSAEVKPLIQHLRAKKKPDQPAEELDEQIDAQLQIIRSKASEESSLFQSNPDIPVIDALVTTICHVGSKTMSHVLAYIERNQGRLITLSQATPDARKQLVSSVVNYWQEVQPGIAVNIVDKLLNYNILTPSAVIEWCLASERLNGGRLLAEYWIYEMAVRTVEKVTRHVRQVITARLNPLVLAAEAEELETTLGSERESMGALFATIDDALVAVADGSADQVLQGGPGMLEVSEERQQLLRLWGTKWRRVFARKAAVEESFVVEGMRNLPPPAEDVKDEEVKLEGDDVKMNGGGMNGEANGEMNGYAADGDAVLGDDGA